MNIFIEHNTNKSNINSFKSEDIVANTEKCDVDAAVCALTKKMLQAVEGALTVDPLSGKSIPSSYGIICRYLIQIFKDSNGHLIYNPSVKVIQKYYFNITGKSISTRTISRIFSYGKLWKIFNITSERIPETSKTRNIFQINFDYINNPAPLYKAASKSRVMENVPYKPDLSMGQPHVGTLLITRKKETSFKKENLIEKYFSEGKDEIPLKFETEKEIIHYSNLPEIVDIDVMKAWPTKEAIELLDEKIGRNNLELRNKFVDAARYDIQRFIVKKKKGFVTQERFNVLFINNFLKTFEIRKAFKARGIPFHFSHEREAFNENKTCGTVWKQDEPNYHTQIAEQRLIENVDKEHTSDYKDPAMKQTGMKQLSDITPKILGHTGYNQPESQEESLTRFVYSDKKVVDTTDTEFIVDNDERNPNYISTAELIEGISNLIKN